MRSSLFGLVLALLALVQCPDAKKYCWYFEGGYPIYFICRSHEDCCGTRCCVRALSIQRLWYFWLLFMMAVFSCCGAGFFLRRRMYLTSLSEEATFNLFFTRQPGATAAGAPQSSTQHNGDQGAVIGSPLASSYHGSFSHTNSPPPSYCSHSPPPYDQLFQTLEKK
ncbi:vesicular, overexpressed in cancer, prosurvival protein 1 [Arapaima gigas]